MSLAEFLSSVPGFSEIPAADMAEVAAICGVRRFAAGEALMRQGEAGNCMFLIRQGRVRVVKKDDRGVETASFRLGPREPVGEMALLTGEPRSADVVAEEPVEAVEVRREAFAALILEYPPVGAFLTELLGRRLEEGGGITRVGKYRLLGKLGRGGTGQVFEAVHPSLGRTVAIKMLSHALAMRPGFREHFLEEARTIASLSHPNIVTIYDTEAAYATLFLVMERLPGGDLSRIMRESGRLPPPRAAVILAQVAEALHHAHEQGFVHRDVKPANVAACGGDRFKLMDFGLARPVPVGGAGERPRTVDGTPHYIAPETALGKAVDGRADIYSLGVVAFEMLAGRLPFERDSVQQMLRAHALEEPPDIAALAPDTPAPLVEFVRGTLIKDPTRRLTSWERIRALLAPPQPISIDTRREELLRLRFAPKKQAAVERLLGALADDVRALGGELSRARFEDGPGRRHEP